MTVFLVTGEYNVGSEDGETWWLVGVYGTEDRANTAAEVERAHQSKLGYKVYGVQHPDDWYIDVRVHEEEVQ